MNQNHCEPNPCYDSNSFGFDQFQPSLFPVIRQPIREKTCAGLLAEEQEANIDTQLFQYSVVPQPPQEEMSVEFLQEKRNQMDSVKTFLRKFNRISFYEMPKVLSLEWETILEIELAFEDKHCQPKDILELFRRLHNDEQNIHEELAVYINTPSWDRPIVCYSDDDDEDYAIAVTPSLSTEEPDNSLSMGDEHLDTILETESDEFIKSSVENLVLIPSESEGIPDNMCDVPFHDNSPSLDYVEASPPDSKLVSSEVMKIVIPPFPPADRSDLYEFVDELTHIISPLEYDCFCFKIEPNSGDFTMDVVEDIFPTREPKVQVHNALPTHPTLQLNLDFIISSEFLFAYIVWIFLPFL
uniref:Reverse transcriptase domain-containing protein n=1 Tax=Tanacetum cinerariifolium TaxID=118510 RepID=A0A699KVU8_TANCI|nr:hypothetical protein [Tanacetum cinerariifolium]